MITYTDTIFVSRGSTLNEDTGFYESSPYESINCRVNFGATKITNMNGDEIIAKAKIYFPTNAGISLKDKLKFSDTDESREMHIQSIEYKSDLRGKINHLIIWV